MTSVTQLKRSNPEAEGIPSSAILDFIRAVEQHDHPLDSAHGFMLLRHGSVAAEGWWTPYGPQSPHSQYSLSKSFTSTGIGLAVDQGLLTVDDPVLKFFPNDAPPNPSENLKAMRVQHLLSMNTGHKEDTTGRVFRDLYQVSLFGSRPRHKGYKTGQVSLGEDENWPRTFLSLPVEYQPGTWFVYNTAATYMLSAIITRLTGELLLDYLRPRLFDEPVAACGAWTAEETYEVRVCYYEAVFCPVLRFHYTSGDLQLEAEPNVSWDQTTVTTITGRVAAGIAPQGPAFPQSSGPGPARFNE